MQEVEEVRRRLGRLAWLLDNSIPVPGTRFRVGIDAILGLMPGLGDVLGVLLSSYIVSEAARLGVPRSVLVRMSFNVAVEGFAGMVPFVGDVFDAAWKANQRNIALLESYFAHPHRAARSSRVFVSALLLGLFVLVVLAGTVTVLLVRLVWQAIAA